MQYGKDDFLRMKHVEPCYFLTLDIFFRKNKTVPRSKSVLLYDFGLVQQISHSTDLSVSCLPLQQVSEGALSPDGTVLATASHDGYIKFWQIYIEGGTDKPRSALFSLNEN